MWQRPQQQQTETGEVQLGNAAAHETPIADVPPTWAQVPALMMVQEPLWQHAPGPSPAHRFGLQGTAPLKVPPLSTQSQLVAVMHV